MIDLAELVKVFTQQGDALIDDTLHTAYNATLGLGAASLLAIGGYLTTVGLPLAKPLVQFVVVGTKVSPAIAYVPLFIVTLGGGAAPKIAVVALLTLFPVYEQISQARSDLPARLANLSRTLGASATQEELAFGWGYALQGLARGLVIGAPISVIGSIVGDYIVGGTRPGGIGARIVSAVNSSDSTAILVCILLATSLGVCFYAAAKGVNSWVNRSLHLSSA